MIQIVFKNINGKGYMFSLRLIDQGFLVVFENGFDNIAGKSPENV